MNRWDGIPEFIAVADSNSFTVAATQLNQSTSQVSKAVSRLEQRLGIRLIYRSTRRLALTDAGARYLQQCRQALRNLEQAELELAEELDVPTGTLRINLSGAFQDRFLVPLITAFVANNPRVSIDLHFNDRYVDPIAESFDVSICHGPLPESSCVARRMATLNNLMVAAPSYLQKQGVPATVDELKQHNCLVGADNIWQLSNGVQQRDIRVKGNWHSDNASAILAAVRSGTGIAQLHDFSVRDDIAQGALAEVLPEWNRFPIEVWCLTPDNKFLPAKTRHFVDFLLRQIGNINYPDASAK
jgi:DNA-binding transcriptional LysR family regulator